MRKTRRKTRKRKPGSKKTGCKIIHMRNGQKRYGCWSRGRFKFVSYAGYKRRKA